MISLRGRRGHFKEESATGRDWHSLLWIGRKLETGRSVMGLCTCRVLNAEGGDQVFLDG